MSEVVLKALLAAVPVTRQSKLPGLVKQYIRVMGYDCTVSSTGKWLFGSAWLVVI